MFCCLFRNTLCFFFLFADIYYFIRTIVVGILSGLLNLKNGYSDLLTPTALPSICLSTDLDYMMHMNNARYLRECDFGRQFLLMRTGILRSVMRRKAQCLLGGSTIRFRKPIQPLERFTLTTKILCWDERSFFIEQMFIRRNDNFIAAVVLAKQSLVGATTADVIEDVSGQLIESPPTPPEVQLWTKYNQMSSEILRSMQVTAGSSTIAATPKTYQSPKTRPPAADKLAQDEKSDSSKERMKVRMREKQRAPPSAPPQTDDDDDM